MGFTVTDNEVVIGNGSGLSLADWIDNFAGGSGLGTPGNVLDNGLLGDGSTDDTAALAAYNAESSVLFFPPAVYILDSFTPLAGTKIVIHPGATLKLKSSSAGSLVRINAANVEIRGGVLDGNKAGQGSLRDCLQVLYGGDGLVVEGVTLTSAKRAGVYCVEGQAGRLSGMRLSNVTSTLHDQYGGYFGDLDGLRAENFRAYDIGSGSLHHGITLKTCKRARLLSPVSHRATGIGIELVGGEFNVASNIDVLNPGNIGASIGGGSLCNSFDGGTVNCSVAGPAYGGEMSAVAGDNYGCRLSGLTIFGNYVASPEAWNLEKGISVSNGSNNNFNGVISNNIIHRAQRTMTLNSGTRNFLVTGNMSFDPESYHYEIGGQYISLTNNFATGGTKVFPLNSVTHALISGNTWRDIAEDGIFVATASTDIQLGINYWGSTDKIDGGPGFLPIIQEGNVPTENMTGIAQLYIESGVPKIRLADGTIKTITVT